jgi:hypothetical protein
VKRAFFPTLAVALATATSAMAQVTLIENVNLTNYNPTDNTWQASVTIGTNYRYAPEPGSLTI